MDDIDARMSGDTLIVDVHVNGQVLTLSTPIFYPKEGTAPYPLIIGASNNALPRKLFTDRNIAMDDDYVYIAVNSGTAKLWAISITDPSDVKAVNVEGVTGGSVKG